MRLGLEIGRRIDAQIQIVRNRKIFALELALAIDLRKAGALEILADGSQQRKVLIVAELHARPV